MLRKALLPMLMFACLNSAYPEGPTLLSDPRELALRVENAIASPGIHQIIREAADRYAVTGSNTPDIVRKAFSRVLLEKGGMIIQDPRAKDDCRLGQRLNPDDRTLVKILSIADPASTETQAGAAFLAKNASADYSTRSHALNFLAQFDCQVLLNEVVRDLSKGPRKADKSKEHYEKLILLRAMAHIHPLPKEYAQRLRDELTTTTGYNRDVLATYIPRPNPERERVDLCMHLIRHKREHAFTLLDTISVADPEFVRPYKEELLYIFRDPSHAEQSRSSAFAALGNMNEAIPVAEILQYYQESSGSAQNRIYLYLRSAKIKLTPEQKQKFIDGAKEEHVKNTFKAWNGGE